MESFALTLGVFVLGFALRSFSGVVWRKTGALCILAASFLGAFFIGGESILAGCLALATWFFLPWIEILGRIRHLRLPMRRDIAPAPEPSRQDFPHLRQITREIEDAGWAVHDDLGWEHGIFSQFMRFFSDPKGNSVAALSLSRQGPHAFVHVALTTRAADGRVFRTTNLPFSETMALPPNVICQRDLKASSFAELVAAHALFVDRACPDPAQLSPVDPGGIVRQIEADAAAQVDHNLQRGIITTADADTFRYSWRGFVFLWLRLIGDMVRLA